MFFTTADGSAAATVEGRDQLRALAAASVLVSSTDDQQSTVTIHCVVDEEASALQKYCGEEERSSAENEDHVHEPLFTDSELSVWVGEILGAVWGARATESAPGAAAATALALFEKDPAKFLKQLHSLKPREAFLRDFLMPVFSDRLEKPAEVDEGTALAVLETVWPLTRLFATLSVRAAERELAWKQRGRIAGDLEVDRAADAASSAAGCCAVLRECLLPKLARILSLETLSAHFLQEKVIERGSADAVKSIGCVYLHRKQQEANLAAAGGGRSEVAARLQKALAAAGAGAAGDTAVSGVDGAGAAAASTTQLPYIEWAERALVYFFEKCNFLGERIPKTPSLSAVETVDSTETPATEEGLSDQGRETAHTHEVAGAGKRPAPLLSLYRTAKAVPFLSLDADAARDLASVHPSFATLAPSELTSLFPQDESALKKALQQINPGAVQNISTSIDTKQTLEKQVLLKILQSKKMWLPMVNYHVRGKELFSFFTGKGGKLFAERILGAINQRSLDEDHTCCTTVSCEQLFGAAGPNYMPQALRVVKSRLDAGMVGPTLAKFLATVAAGPTLRQTLVATAPAAAGRVVRAALFFADVPPLPESSSDHDSGEGKEDVAEVSSVRRELSFSATRRELPGAAAAVELLRAFAVTESASSDASEGLLPCGDEGDDDDVQRAMKALLTVLADALVETPEVLVRWTTRILQCCNDRLEAAAPERQTRSGGPGLEPEDATQEGSAGPQGDSPQPQLQNFLHDPRTAGAASTLPAFLATQSRRAAFLSEVGALWTQRVSWQTVPGEANLAALEELSRWRRIATADKENTQRWGESPESPQAKKLAHLRSVTLMFNTGMEMIKALDVLKICAFAQTIAVPASRTHVIENVIAASVPCGWLCDVAAASFPQICRRAVLSQTRGALKQLQNPEEGLQSSELLNAAVRKPEVQQGARERILESWKKVSWSGDGEEVKNTVQEAYEAAVAMQDASFSEQLVDLLDVRLIDADRVASTAPPSSNFNTGAVQEHHAKAAMPMADGADTDGLATPAVALEPLSVPSQVPDPALPGRGGNASARSSRVLLAEGDRGGSQAEASEAAYSSDPSLSRRSSTASAVSKTTRATPSTRQEKLALQTIRLHLKDGNAAEAKTCFIERASKHLLSTRGVLEILPEVNFKDGKTSVTQAELLFGLLCDLGEEEGADAAEEHIPPNTQQGPICATSGAVDISAIESSASARALSHIPLELVNETLLESHCPPAVALEMFVAKKSARKARGLLLRLLDEEKVQIAVPGSAAATSADCSAPSTKVPSPASETGEESNSVSVEQVDAHLQVGGGSSTLAVKKVGNAGLPNAYKYLTKQTLWSDTSAEELQRLGAHLKKLQTVDAAIFAALPVERLSLDDAARLPSYGLCAAQVQKKNKQQAAKIVLDGLRHHGVQDACDVHAPWASVNWQSVNSPAILESALAFLHETYPNDDYGFASEEHDSLLRSLNWPLLVTKSFQQNAQLLLDVRSNLVLKLELLRTAASPSPSANQQGSHSQQHLQGLVDELQFRLVKHYYEVINAEESCYCLSIETFRKAWEQVNWRGAKNSAEMHAWANHVIAEQAKRCPEEWDPFLRRLDLSQVDFDLLLDPELVSLDLLKSTQSLHPDTIHSILLRRITARGELCEETFGCVSWSCVSPQNLQVALGLLLTERQRNCAGSPYPDDPSSETEDVPTRIASRLPLDRCDLSQLSHPLLPIYTLLSSRFSRLSFEAVILPVFFQHCQTYDSQLREDNRRLENLLHTLFDTYKAILLRESGLAEGQTAAGAAAAQSEVVSVAVVSGERCDGSGRRSDSDVVAATRTTSVALPVGALAAAGLDSAGSDPFSPLPFTKEQTARIFTLLDACDCSRQQILPLLDNLDLCYLPRALYNVEWVDPSVLLECKLENTERKLEKKLDLLSSQLQQLGAAVSQMQRQQAQRFCAEAETARESRRRKDLELLITGHLMEQTFAKQMEAVVGKVLERERDLLQMATGGSSGDRSNNKPNGAGGGGAMDAIAAMNVMQTKEEVQAAKEEITQLREEFGRFEKSQRSLLESTLPNVIMEGIAAAGPAAAISSVATGGSAAASGTSGSGGGPSSGAGGSGGCSSADNGRGSFSKGDRLSDILGANVDAGTAAGGLSTVSSTMNRSALLSTAPVGAAGQDVAAEAGVRDQPPQLQNHQQQQASSSTSLQQGGPYVTAGRASDSGKSDGMFAPWGFGGGTVSAEAQQHCHMSGQGMFAPAPFGGIAAGGAAVGMGVATTTMGRMGFEQQQTSNQVGGGPSSMNPFVQQGHNQQAQQQQAPFSAARGGFHPDACAGTVVMDAHMKSTMSYCSMAESATSAGADGAPNLPPNVIAPAVMRGRGGGGGSQGGAGAAATTTQPALWTQMQQGGSSGNAFMSQHQQPFGQPQQPFGQPMGVQQPFGASGGPFQQGFGGNGGLQLQQSGEMQQQQQQNPFLGPSSSSSGGVGSYGSHDHMFDSVHATPGSGLARQERNSQHGGSSHSQSQRNPEAQEHRLDALNKLVRDAGMLNNSRMPPHGLEEHRQQPSSGAARGTFDRGERSSSQKRESSIEEPRNNRRSRSREPRAGDRDVRRSPNDQDDRRMTNLSAGRGAGGRDSSLSKEDHAEETAAQYAASLFGKSAAASGHQGPPVYWGRIVGEEELPEGIKDFLPKVMAAKPKILIRKNNK